MQWDSCKIVVGVKITLSAMNMENAELSRTEMFLQQVIFLKEN